MLHCIIFYFKTNNKNYSTKSKNFHLKKRVYEKKSCLVLFIFINFVFAYLTDFIAGIEHIFLLEEYIILHLKLPSSICSKQFISWTLIRFPCWSWCLSLVLQHVFFKAKLLDCQWFLLHPWGVHWLLTFWIDWSFLDCFGKNTEHVFIYVFFVMIW